MQNDLEKIIIDSKDGIGLVLSGGGGRGSYQVGVIKALAERGIKFELVAGTSVGALNGALVAAERVDKMIEIWENINLFKVLNINPASLAKGSLVDTKALENLIRESISETDAKKIIESQNKLIVISSCLQSKKEIIYKNFKNYEHLVRALLASSAMPVAFPSQKFLHDNQEEDDIDIMQLIDGGIINNFPIDEAVKTGRCKSFITSSVYTPELFKMDAEKKRYTGVMKIGMRAIDVLFTNSYLKGITSVREKIELADELEKIVKKKIYITKAQKEARGIYDKYLGMYQGRKIIEINPKEELPADLFDFFSKKARKAIEMGYRDALKVLENVELI